MKRSALKYWFLTGVLSLCGLYFFPLWKISLGVPQYPKDITIHIWIDRIENGTEKALQIMNVLNHNIGMKEIDPAGIPELKIFPWILAGLILTGIVVSFVRKQAWRVTWMILIIACLILAVYDFYLWQYDFGHNLSPDAPIKIEGSSFQPPLIGQKEIVNFIVSSYPMSGIVFPFVSLLISGYSLIKGN